MKALGESRVKELISAGIDPEITTFTDHSTQTTNVSGTDKTYTYFMHTGDGGTTDTIIIREAARTIFHTINLGGIIEALRGNNSLAFAPTRFKVHVDLNMGKANENVDFELQNAAGESLEKVTLSDSTTAIRSYTYQGRQR